MISMAGSQMQLWALYWHIRTLSSEPIAVSGIGIAALSAGADLLHSSPGVVADRFRPAQG